MAGKSSLTDLIGVGLYSPAEAARYARVKTAKLSRWLYGTSVDEPVISAQLGRAEESGERVVTFLDFAQTLAINEIRLQARIPLCKIKEAYIRAQEDYEVEYPFAVKHGVFVFGDLKRPEKCHLGIFIPGDEKLGDFKKRAFQLTGKQRKNQLFWEVVKPFSARLEFNESGVAVEYAAFESRGYHIVMNPDMRFGKPYILEAGYEAETLIHAAKVEGSVQRAAKLYEVEESAVQAALDYYKQLSTPPTPPSPKPLAA